MAGVRVRWNVMSVRARVRMWACAVIGPAASWAVVVRLNVQADTATTATARATTAAAATTATAAVACAAVRETPPATAFTGTASVVRHAVAVCADTHSAAADART